MVPCPTGRGAAWPCRAAHGPAVRAHRASFGHTLACGRRWRTDVAAQAQTPDAGNASPDAPAAPPSTTANGAASTSTLPAPTPPPHPDPDVLIEVRNVHKSFGTKNILRGCSFKVRRGEAVGIIGSSGTGKSTTLRIMAGLLNPDAGEVYIKGIPRKGLIADDPESTERLHVGMVFQSAALFDSLTVGENVGFLLYEHTDMPHPEIERRVEAALGMVGITADVAQNYPASLSGGMRKRVALARAVAAQGLDEQETVLMYDEPTAGLDPVASTVVEDLMRDLHKTSGAKGISSYIVVTHQHSTIRRACDRIIFLHRGRVVWEGSAAEFDTTDEPIVRQFATGSLDGPIKYQ
ncbi:unnamed protein product [Pedinophyceae sp. YPF-701]|nr:unnamed protein product [Pedinophyceae sp. YPF-701]